MTDQLSLGTEYISPTELWVRVDAYEAEAHEVGAGVALDEKLRIWVKGKKRDSSSPNPTTSRFAR